MRTYVVDVDAAAFSAFLVALAAFMSPCSSLDYLDFFTPSSSSSPGHPVHRYPYRHPSPCSLSASSASCLSCRQLAHLAGVVLDLEYTEEDLFDAENLVDRDEVLAEAGTSARVANQARRGNAGCNEVSLVGWIGDE